MGDQLLNVALGPSPPCCPALEPLPEKQVWFPVTDPLKARPHFSHLPPGENHPQVLTAFPGLGGIVSKKGQNVSALSCPGPEAASLSLSECRDFLPDEDVSAGHPLVTLGWLLTAASGALRVRCGGSGTQNTSHVWGAHSSAGRETRACSAPVLPLGMGVPASDQWVRCEGTGPHGLGADGQNWLRCPKTWNGQKRPLTCAGEKNWPDTQDRADVQTGITEQKASSVPPSRAASARGPPVMSWQPRMPPGCRHVSGSVISLTIMTRVAHQPLGSGEKNRVFL